MMRSKLDLAQNFVSTDIAFLHQEYLNALKERKPREPEVDEKEAMENMRLLQEAGVRCIDKFDVFNCRTKWSSVSRSKKDPVLIICVGLYFNFATDNSGSQYDAFDNNKAHFFQTAMDSLKAQFPNSLIAILHHTAYSFWDCEATWKCPDAYIRAPVIKRASSQRRTRPFG